MPGWEVSLLVAFYYDNVAPCWNEAPQSLWLFVCGCSLRAAASGEHFPIHALMGKVEQ